MRNIRQHTRFKKFVKDISTHTPFTKMSFLLITLWLLFSAGVYMAEQGIEGTSINSYREALYWRVAALSTAGIADKPITGAAQLIGGLWFVFGSVLFFGAHRSDCYNLFYEANATTSQKNN